MKNHSKKLNLCQKITIYKINDSKEGEKELLVLQELF